MPGEVAMLMGIEDMEAAIDTLVAAAPDAIQLSVGRADLLPRPSARTQTAPWKSWRPTKNRFRPAVLQGLVHSSIAACSG